ncbi:cytochrome b/b6 domain-containing protein [Shewanella sp. NIFS-20-20]|uniref:cytochrome b/b6 domain-containing protein n=1 Tax=Shewanella sp. NIFS-20-20 TaxID=2853806 RepID=UPI001C493843|nr:cytochrome b/b6 domain-containing protein [Shewanella sp. NIFS-20-20]MBV7317166.1 cytochrome b/b6 domain-containing protein [Shewanella sp. NIFS-20-20]
MAWLTGFWAYLGQQQQQTTRTLHVLLIFLVLNQFLLSNFMHVKRGAFVGSSFEMLASWLHCVEGSVMAVVILGFVTVQFRQRGWRYYYPYLAGDLQPFYADLRQLKSKQLPNVQPGGVAAVVQGLGLAAILAVVLSGLVWFALWLGGIDWPWLRELHQDLTGVLIAYIVGHGGMGLLHYQLSRID